jgi:hypothetical protein
MIKTKCVLLASGAVKDFENAMTSSVMHFGGQVVEPVACRRI